MGNSVLWSLSYEWWFYMLFFFLAYRIRKPKLNKWVYIITISAAISYLFYPFTVNRLIMYFAIWWIGAQMADTYINGKGFSFRSIMPIFYVLLTITVILSVNLALKFSYISFWYTCKYA